jgi:hypothetical protein
MRRVLTLLFALCLCTSAGAQGIAALWNLCPKGKEVIIGSHIVAEMIVISDCDSPNMSQSVNVSVGTLETRLNRKTVYVSTPDGKIGLKLLFDRPGENALHRGDVIEIDFYGCTASRSVSPDAFTISGIRATDNILSHRTGGQIPVKEKFISDLTDRDINTYVTLKDIDIVFKDGSYYNVHEDYTTKMDGWASLMRDLSGNTIYMLLTNNCPWRRTGKDLPKGIGTLSGIVVYEQNRRYGPDMGRYSIRPVDESDIRIESGSSPWKTYVGWVKPAGSGQSLDFEISGTVNGLFKKGVANDKIYNDVGNTAAFLWTDSGSEVRVYSGYNSLSKENHGFLSNASLMFIGRSVDWYEWDSNGNVIGSKAFYISFNASKLKESVAQLNFEWSAGTQDGNKSWYYPIDWKVECSVDGENWVLLKENTTHSTSIMLHNVPWGDCIVKGSGHDFKKRPNYDTAMGPQQHSYVLPAEVLGEKKVLLRLSPASADVARVRVEAQSSYRSGQVRSGDTERQTWIRFESVQIDYKK